MAWTKVKSLQKFLDDALAERENLAAEYKKHPNDRSYGKILENNRTIEQLHVSVLTLLNILFFFSVPDVPFSVLPPDFPFASLTLSKTFRTCFHG